MQFNFQILPKGVKMLILFDESFDLIEINSFRKVCKEWNNLIEDDFGWKKR